MPAPVPSHERVSAPGIAFAIASYLLWGVLPLLFLALPPTGAPEIVAWRIVLSLAFCVILLTVTGGWSRFMALVRDRVALVFGAGLTVIVVYVFLNSWRSTLITAMSLPTSVVAAFIAAGAFAGWSLVAGESFEPCRVAAAGLEVRHSMQVEYDQLPRGSIGDRYGSSSGCVPGDDGVGN